MRQDPRFEAQPASSSPETEVTAGPELKDIARQLDPPEDVEAFMGRLVSALATQR